MPMGVGVAQRFRLAKHAKMCRASPEQPRYTNGKHHLAVRPTLAERDSSISLLDAHLLREQGMGSSNLPPLRPTILAFFDLTKTAVGGNVSELEGMYPEQARFGFVQRFPKPLKIVH